MSAGRTGTGAGGGRQVGGRQVGGRRLVTGALTSVVGAGLLAACGGSPAAVRPPVTAVPATSAAVPTSTTTPSGTAVASWSRAVSPVLAVGGGATSTFGAVLAPSQPGGSWTVVGTRTGADGSATATVWTSPDTRTWAPAALTAPAVMSAATAATTFGSRTVVVGSVGLGADRRAAVWVSSRPGAAFAPVPDQSAFSATGTLGDGSDGDASSGSGPVGAEMHVVGAGALGLFASGTVGGQSAMWYSTDGRHFTRLAGAERVIDAAARPDVHSLLVTPTGVFAAGSRGDGPATDGTLWTSTDGINWEQQADTQQAFSGGGDHTINAITTIVRGTDTVYVAVGGVDTGGAVAPASWISPDGYSWSAPSLSFPREAGRRPAPGGAQVDAVSTGSTGMVAVGGGDGIALAWTSVDGRSWTPVALPPVATVASWHAGLVASDGTTTLVGDPDIGAPRLFAGVAIGATAPGTSPRGSWRELTAAAATWGSPRPDAVPVQLLSDGRTLRLVVDVAQPGQVLGTDHTSVSVLTSTDGSAWTAAPAGGSFVDGHVAAAVAVPPSATVAVGGQAPTTGLLTAAEPRAAAWHTAGGTTVWAASSATKNGFGTGASATAATGVTRLRSGLLVAVGTGPSTGTTGPAGHPVAWTSRDGATWTATGGLDRPANLLAATPNGVCTGPRGAVAVGAAAVAGPGSRAVAWTSAAGSGWTAATVPAGTSGSTGVIVGCAPVSGPATSGPTLIGTVGVVAWGAATASDGAEEPALWQSGTGATWTRRKVASFVGGLPAPLTDVVTDRSSWLAVGGGTQPATVTAPGGALGLWRSGDAGTTWTRVDTSTPPWQATTSSSLQQVAWLSGTAVVAGTVDGQLAVWVATSAVP